MRIQLLRGLRSRSREDDGAVAIVVSLLLTVFIILAAFAADIGNAYAQTRQLSVAADADALAAAAKVGEAIPPGVPCTQSTLDSLRDSAGNVVGATAIATATANAINTSNSKGLASEPVNTVAVACVKTKVSDPAPNAVEVTVNNGRQVKTAFAGIIGIDHISTNSYAVAHYIRATTSGGLRPWAVCSGTVTAAQDNPTTTYWSGIDKTPAGGGPCETSAPGNWGAVDFDGGNNAAGDLSQWTQYGYPGAVTIPDPKLPADPGVSNSVTNALHSMVGQVVLFPVVTGFNDAGNGNNASFPAVGIVTVKVCGVKYQNNTYTSDLSGNSSGCWVTPSPPVSSTTTTSIVASGGTIAKNSATLTTVDSKFTAAMVNDPNVTVTVPGAGNGGSNLVTTIVGFTSANVVTLADNAGTKIVSPGVPVTITTATTTTTAGFGPYDDKGNLLNHIQLRWVGYSTSSYSGSNPKPCDFTDRLCAGVTQLWK